MELKKEILDYIQELTKDNYEGYELQLGHICKKLSLKCFTADFSDAISGCIVKDAKEHYWTGIEICNIYVNRRYPKNRRRVTIAHLIGHYISYLKGSYSKEEFATKGYFVDKAISSGAEGELPDTDNEIEADLISRELVMPIGKEELM